MWIKDLKISLPEPTDVGFQGTSLFYWLIHNKTILMFQARCIYWLSCSSPILHISYVDSQSDLIEMAVCPRFGPQQPMKIWSRWGLVLVHFAHFSLALRYSAMMHFNLCLKHEESRINNVLTSIYLAWPKDSRWYVTMIYLVWHINWRWPENACDQRNKVSMYIVVQNKYWSVDLSLRRLSWTHVMYWTANREGCVMFVSHNL